MSHPNQNQQQQPDAMISDPMKSSMTSAWSTDSKAFVPNTSSSMAQPFPAPNGSNPYNTSATFTPYPAQQPQMPQTFNYHAQLFQPQTVQNSQMMGQQPMPAPPAAQPQTGSTAPAPMNTGGLNSIYPSQQNQQWSNQMYNNQPPPVTTFTPTNVNAGSFQSQYERSGYFNASQPQPQPMAQGQFIPSGQMNYQGYNNNYNPNQNVGRPMGLYNPPPSGGQPSQSGHHKKPYNKGGNQHFSGAPQQHYKPKSNQHHQNSGGMKKSSFSGFEAPSDFAPDMNLYKQRNIELQKPLPVAQPAQPTPPMPWQPVSNGTAKAFVPDWSKLAKQIKFNAPSLKKRDILKENLEKHDIKAENDVEHFRKLMQLLKDSKEGKEVKLDELPAKKKEKAEENEDDKDKDVDEKNEEKEKEEENVKDRRKGAIHLTLFQKVTELCLFASDSKQNLHCLNMSIVEREVHGELEAKLHGRDGGFKKDQKYKRGDNQGQHKKGNYNNKYESSTPWIQADSEEKKKLKAQAAKMKKKLGQDKSVLQKIALILNIISPENSVKKMRELRQFLFPDFKTKSEAFDEEVEYNEEEHKLTDDNLDNETLDTIVKNIFRKAQEEKLFCIFYGQVCEELIHLELSLRDMDQKRANMKFSKFRKNLFEVCKDCFEKFFDGDERQKQTQDSESAIRFKLKLFGNIEFVGELYRRKILPEATLVSVFQSLLGISDTNDTADDLVVEGAVNLMNKVGQTFEQNVKNAGDRKKDDKKKYFSEILNRFDVLVQAEDDDVISKRVKLLIKNMFSNKDSGWLKTQDINKGPKTKSQVQKEVEDKHLKEQQQRNEGTRDRDRRGYNDYQNDGRRGNRKGDGYGAAPQGKQKYQPKGAEHTYGDGKREGKHNDTGRDDGKHGRRGGHQQQEEKVEYEEIDDNEMSSQLKQNFEQYCIDYKTALEAEQEEGNDVNAEDKAVNKRPDYELYTNLRKVNGKTGDQIVSSLLSSVFDDETKKVEQHLADYFKLLINDKILKNKDINQGLSRFGELLPELVLDCPQIHKYLMDCLIRPLQKKNIVQLKFISWKVEEQKKDGDEDDDIIFGTNPFFKLLALIILDLKKNDNNKRTWQEVVNHIEKDLQWRSIIDERHKSIEDADDLWSDITEELKDEVAASIILPLLENNKKKLQTALKNAK